jgi:hypothetical protein
MSENQNNEEPKIIVDEDWKSQVEREKEELTNAPDANAEAEQGEGELPPASILGLVSMFATQSMAALGLLVDPETGQGHVSRPMAKHFIDLLGVLQEKTEGNLTEDEAGHLRDALHQLRMVYVQTEGQQPDGAAPETGSSIELP